MGMFQHLAVRHRAFEGGFVDEMVFAPVHFAFPGAARVVAETENLMVGSQSRKRAGQRRFAGPRGRGKDDQKAATVGHCSLHVLNLLAHLIYDGLQVKADTGQVGGLRLGTQACWPRD